MKGTHYIKISDVELIVVNEPLIEWAKDGSKWWYVDDRFLKPSTPNINDKGFTIEELDYSI